MKLTPKDFKAVAIIAAATSEENPKVVDLLVKQIIGEYISADKQQKIEFLQMIKEKSFALIESSQAAIVAIDCEMYDLEKSEAAAE